MCPLETADFAVTVDEDGDLRTLRRVLRLAVEWGKLDRAPAIHELPLAKGRDRMLSFAEEAKSLAKASDNLREATVLEVDTGMRPISELFPLKWADVDLTTSAECPHGVNRCCRFRRTSMFLVEDTSAV
jgi:integrase